MGLADAFGFSKTTTFLATVQIHELDQVPLLHARFRVKWKFKGATTVHEPEDGNTTVTGTSAVSGHGQSGFGKRFLHPRSALHHVSSGSNNGTLSSSQGSGSNARSRSGSPARWDSTGEDDGDGGGGYRTPSRSPPHSPELGASASRTLNAPRTPGGGNSTAASNVAFTSPFSSGGETLYTHGRSDSGGGGDDLSGSGGRRRGGGDLSTMPSMAGAAAASGGAGNAHRPEPKGSTTFVPLRSHTATFSREITCPVQVPLRSLSSSTLSASPRGAKYQLQPSPMRLSVKQEVLLEDGKREEERLGEVILDLSQFVGQKKEDARPRRYLLQDCKSNAVLRITVKMELLEGEASFIAPPLRSGQLAPSSHHAKGLASSQNSPMNRSTVSLNKSASASTARLSTSTFSTSHTGSSHSSRLHRANSVSSTGSSHSPEVSKNGSERSYRIDLGGQNNKARNGKGKKKGWHPPSSALVLSTSLFPPERPSLAHTFSTTSAALATERSAPDLINDLFNRPRRNPSWVGFSAASRPTTPSVEKGEAFGGLGQPFEYNSSSGGGRKGKKDRKSAPPVYGNGLTAEGAEKAGKAWSIRSGIERHKEKNREKSREKKEKKEEQRRASATYDTPPLPSTATSSRPASVSSTAPPPPRRPPPSPPTVSVSVQPPTPQPSFTSPSPSFATIRAAPPPLSASSSNSSVGSAYTTRPPRPSSPRLPPPTSAAPSRPASLASSFGATRSLSVRWGDEPTPSSSAASSPSTAPTSLPASSAHSAPRSLRHSKSTDSSLSSRSGISVGSNGGGGRSRTSTYNSGSGLGLSTTHEGDEISSRDFARGPGGGRPASTLSFNSVVTPPSPEKKATSKKDEEGEGGKGLGGGGSGWMFGGGKKEKEGVKGPGGVEFVNSWGK